MDAYFEQLHKTNYHLRGHGSDTLSEGTKGYNKIPSDLVPDVYGSGKLIEDFQDEMALELGKESGIFFPSGTMAQQIALRLHCDEKGLMRAAYHPLCHLEIHEQNGLKVLHQIEAYLVGDANRLFTLEDLKKIDNAAVVLFELPQREIGGQLPKWKDLVNMTQYCRERGFKLHLDGARLFETLPYYQKTASEVAALFDTVYISFYKGIGGITGAMLLGPREMMEEAKVWKRRHGGDLFHLYPYIISARYNYELRKNNMAGYWNKAIEYAAALSELPKVRIVPEVPVCNMFHVFIDQPVDRVKGHLVKVMQKWNLALFGGLSAYSDGVTKTEMWIGDRYGLVDKERIQGALKELGHMLAL